MSINAVDQMSEVVDAVLKERVFDWAVTTQFSGISNFAKIATLRIFRDKTLTSFSIHQKEMENTQLYSYSSDIEDALMLNDDHDYDIFSPPQRSLQTMDSSMSLDSIAEEKPKRKRETQNRRRLTQNETDYLCRIFQASPRPNSCLRAEIADKL